MLYHTSSSASRSRCIRIRLAVLLTVAVAACSTAKAPSGDVDAPVGADDAQVVDGSDPTGAPDADPAAPDADPTVPDADPDVPDGHAHDSAVGPGDPDARIVDASVPVPDAQPPDAAVTCPTQPCDLVAQCGCAANQACDIDFTDLVGTQCRAVTAAGTEEDTCTTATACAEGYVCPGSGAGVSCARYCDSDDDCAQPRGACALQLTDSDGDDIPGARVCSSGCDPAHSAAGGCPPSWKCGFFTVGDDDRDIVDCTPAGNSQHGAACTNDSTCAADTMCVMTTSRRCRKVCNRTTGGTECASLNLTCAGFGPALVVGGTEYGFCN